MKGRVLFTALLALIFCFTAVLPLAAVQPPTAKELVLNAIKNVELELDPGFYEKSTGETNLKVTRFGGSLQKLGDFTGSKMKLYMEFDNSIKAMKMSYNTAIKGMVHDGDIYLKEDKVILSKEFFSLLQDFGLDLFEELDITLEQAPEYIYLVDPQIKSVWEQMADFQNQQLPEEYKELLLFIVEAIPSDNFSLSPTKVTIQLDQDGLVDTIVNLATKMTLESERAADILLSANQYQFKQMGMNIEDMKREMVSSFEAMPVPAREEVEAIVSLIEINDFTYEYSILPGGPQNFNLDLAFNAPDGSTNGSFGISVDMKGKQENLEGSYRIAGKYNDSNGTAVDFACDGNFNYAGPVYRSDMILDVTAKDNITGELMLDFGLTSDSTSQVDTNLIMDVPELTSENSLDVTGLIPTGYSAIMPAPTEFDFGLMVNGAVLEAKASVGEQGEMMLPARAVLEQLGCSINWVAPDELQIARDDKIISMFIGQNQYTVNDQKQELITSPILESGRAMIPLSFIVAELGVEMKFEGNVIVIN